MIIICLYWCIILYFYIIFSEVYIPPSGRRAERAQRSGVETPRLGVRLGKNYVPIKLCIISKNRIEKTNKNNFLSKSEKSFHLFDKKFNFFWALSWSLHQHTILFFPSQKYLRFSWCCFFSFLFLFFIHIYGLS